MDILVVTRWEEITNVIVNKLYISNIKQILYKQLNTRCYITLSNRYSLLNETYNFMSNMKNTKQR